MLDAHNDNDVHYDDAHNDDSRNDEARNDDEGDAVFAALQDGEQRRQTMMAKTKSEDYGELVEITAAQTQKMFDARKEFQKMRMLVSTVSKFKAAAQRKDLSNAVAGDDGANVEELRERMSRQASRHADQLKFVSAEKEKRTIELMQSIKTVQEERAAKEQIRLKMAMH